MQFIYFLLAEGAYGFLRAIFDIYQALAHLWKRYRWYPPDDDFPDGDAEAGVRNRPPRPGGSNAAQAKPEVEGRNFSVVP
ncbi:MAG TPA: hypothetical protein DDW76_28055 [Cyanobacteria bacterium UBA11369]|nr:hypothetical protein [Cyanobacteria bacterium UBA11371]HBE36196.1 hypothetical protein [Cyanobacteria bacterium UBA11368]HBE52520.1 hypothetical protein [Cyanobacteria bacterium UBA11369]